MLLQLNGVLPVKTGETLIAKPRSEESTVLYVTRSLQYLELLTAASMELPTSKLHEGLSVLEMFSLLTARKGMTDTASRQPTQVTDLIKKLTLLKM